MNESATKLVGLIRDVLMAGFGVAILFGAHISETQTVAVIALAAPLVALGAFIYSNVSSPKGKI